MADPEAEGKPLNFRADRQVAQQLFGIDELQGPGVTAQRHIQAAVPGHTGRYGEVGGLAQAGDRETVGACETAGGGDLQIEQVETVGERDGGAWKAGADGQQGIAVQAEVDQRARVFGGGGQAQAGSVGRHGEGVALRVRIKVRVEAAGVGAEVGQAVVGGHALDRAEAQRRRAHRALVGCAVVAEAECPGAIGFGRSQAAEGGIEAGDGGWIGLTRAAGCRGSVQTRWHGR